MLRNNRIYLKRPIDESMMLNESGDARQTNFKLFLIGLLKAAWGNEGPMEIINKISDEKENYKGWAVHHINGSHKENPLDNIALVAVNAHNSITGASQDLSKAYNKLKKDVTDPDVLAQAKQQYNAANKQRYADWKKTNSKSTTDDGDPTYIDIGEYIDIVKKS